VRAAIAAADYPREVVFCCFSPDDVAIYQAELQ
jgi:hypothetical protein